MVEHDFAQAGQLARADRAFGIGRGFDGVVLSGGQRLDDRPCAHPVPVGETLQGGELLRRRLGGEPFSLGAIDGDLDPRGRVGLGHLRRQPGIVRPRRDELGGGRSRLALGGVDSGSRLAEPSLSRRDQLSLAVVGELALADQANFELRFKAADQVSVGRRWGQWRRGAGRGDHRNREHRGEACAQQAYRCLPRHSFTNWVRDHNTKAEGALSQRRRAIYCAASQVQEKVLPSPSSSARSASQSARVTPFTTMTLRV